MIEVRLVHTKVELDDTHGDGDGQKMVIVLLLEKEERKNKIG